MQRRGREGSGPREAGTLCACRGLRGDRVPSAPPAIPRAGLGTWPGVPPSGRGETSDILALHTARLCPPGGSGHLPQPLASTSKGFHLHREPLAASSGPGSLDDRDFLGLTCVWVCVGAQL